MKVNFHDKFVHNFVKLLFLNKIGRRISLHESINGNKICLNEARERFESWHSCLLVFGPKRIDKGRKSRRVMLYHARTSETLNDTIKVFQHYSIVHIWVNSPANKLRENAFANNLLVHTFHNYFQTKFILFLDKKLNCQENVWIKLFIKLTIYKFKQKKHLNYNCCQFFNIKTFSNYFIELLQKLLHRNRNW